MRGKEEGGGNKANNIDLALSHPLEVLKPQLPCFLRSDTRLPKLLRIFVQGFLQFFLPWTLCRCLQTLPSNQYYVFITQFIAGERDSRCYLCVL